MNVDREVDLLIAGAGPAGMTAALVASLEGLDVLLCEKSDQVGGTGATSAGTLWIPGNSESKAAGYDDSAEAAERYLDALIGRSTNRELRAAFLRTGPVAIDYLSARTDVTFLACGTHPDYRSNMPGAAIAGRAIIPQPFDGRLLGEDFRRVRPPIPEYMVFGGMMVGKTDIPPLIGRFQSVANFIHCAKLFARYLADRLKYPRGTRLMMGNALIARLLYSLRKRKVPILFDAAIVDFIGDRHGISGARIVLGGSDIVIKVRRGVVLATGGYAHNKSLRAAFMPQPVPRHSMSHAGNSGDGITIGQRVGARIAPEEHGNSGLWTPASITTRPDGSQGLYPHLVLDRAKPGLIAVNSAGRRFVNEAASYHDFVEAMLESHEEYPLDSGLSDLRRALHQDVRPGAGLSGSEQSLAAAAHRLSLPRQHAGRAGRQDFGRRDCIARDGRAPQSVCGNGRRRRFRQGRDRAQSLQRRPRPQAQSMHRPTRDSAVLCARGLAGGHRRQHRAVDG